MSEGTLQWMSQTGCSSNGCIVEKPIGMGTNGQCTCPVWKLHKKITMLQTQNERLDRELFEAKARVRELEQGWLEVRRRVLAEKKACGG